MLQTARRDIGDLLLTFEGPKIFAFCATMSNLFPIVALWQVFMNPKLGKASKSKI